MAKTYHVYSKLATDVEYPEYMQGGADIPVKGKSVFIKGGAGVANKYLQTPLGVHTEITEEEAEILNRHPVFKIHRDNGFVKIEKAKSDVEKVVADMGDKVDPSAPLTEADKEAAKGNRLQKEMV